MTIGISKTTRDEILFTLKNRYKLATKKEKTCILDEFTAVSGYHRKHVTRLLSNKYQSTSYEKNFTYKRIYNGAVK
jgi:hypothetical protein